MVNALKWFESRGRGGLIKLLLHPLTFKRSVLLLWLKHCLIETGIGEVTLDELRWLRVHIHLVLLIGPLLVQLILW